MESHNEMDKGSPQGPDPLQLGSHGWFLTRTVPCLLKKADNLASVGANESYGSGSGKISELAAIRPKEGFVKKTICKLLQASMDSNLGFDRFN